MRVPTTTVGLVANLVVALVFTGASIGFLIWRQDMPPDNPGGPIGSMGGWYVFWNWIAIGPGPMLSVWGWFNVLLFSWGKFKERVGAPPPVPEGQTAGSPVRNGVTALICLALVGWIAVYIATHPAHNAKQALITGSLIVLSLPVTFAMVPGIRAGVWRWLRWLTPGRVQSRRVAEDEKVP